MSCLPEMCLRKRPRDRNFEKARDRLSSELDVVKLLRQLRLLNISVKQSHTDDTVKQMKQQARRTSLDDADHDDTSKSEIELV